MRIPVNWHLGGLEDYHGKVWFRRRFRAAGYVEHATLRFNGVDYFCSAWINGKYLGTHEGYFAPFEFDVSRILEEENLLSVKVDSPWEKPEDWPNRKRLIKGVYGHHDCRPGGAGREGQRWNTGGIWNSVELILTGCVKVDSVMISQKMDGSMARLCPRLTLRNMGERRTAADLRLVIREENGREVARLKRAVRLSPGVNEIRFRLSISRPRLWWPWDRGEQNMCSFEVEVSVAGGVSDRVGGRFGLRSFRTDRKWNWYINGQRFFPRGTNVIHTQWLSEMDRKKYERDLRLVKECNINFIRVHAHVERKELYDVADEMGILVWQDFPLQWSYHRDIVKRALPMMEEMITMLFNHPSITVWCCHNEPQAEDIKWIDVPLYRLAKKLDKTRYVHLASDFREHVYPGWYHGDYHMYAGIPGGPCPTEFGAQALMNVKSMKETFGKDLWPPNWSKWEFHNFQYEETFRVAKIRMGNSIEEFVENSQDYQARLLKFAVESYRRRKYTGITGIFQFMFADPWPAITWSVVDYYRRPKKGYFVLRKVYSPVHLIITPPRDELSRGTGFYGDLTVVNDLPREFKGARYRWWIESPSGRVLFEKVGKVDVPADGVVTVYPLRPMETVKIPEDAELGEWKVRIRLEHGTNVIAENEETFRVVPREKLPSA
jgi:beta-mannosidase